MMLITSELEVSISEVIRSQAKISLAPDYVSVDDEDSEGKKKKVLNINYSNPLYVVKKYFEYINYFNNISEHQTFVFGDRRLEEVMVLNEFVPFITPKTVRYVPGLYWAKDLLKRSGSNGSTCDFDEFVRLNNHIRRWFKKDAHTEVTSLAAIKVDKSLADVLPMVAYKGKVSFDDKAFVPLEIYDSCLSNLFESDYFNTKASRVLTQYISQMKF